MQRLQSLLFLGGFGVWAMSFVIAAYLPFVLPPLLGLYLLDGRWRVAMCTPNDRSRLAALCLTVSGVSMWVGTALAVAIPFGAVIQAFDSFDGIRLVSFVPELPAVRMVGALCIMLFAQALGALGLISPRLQPTAAAVRGYRALALVPGKTVLGLSAAAMLLWGLLTVMD